MKNLENRIAVTFIGHHIARCRILGEGEVFDIRKEKEATSKVWNEILDAGYWPNEERIESGDVIVDVIENASDALDAVSFDWNSLIKGSLIEVYGDAYRRKIVRACLNVR